VADASELAMVREDKADGPDLVQMLDAEGTGAATSEPAGHSDPVLTAEASYHAPYDHCTVKYLRQAGVELRSSGSSNWDPRQQPRHDAGKNNREIAGNRALARSGASIKGS